VSDNQPFVNKPGGVINLNGAQGFGNQLGTRTFVNQGTLNKLGTGTFPMSVQNTNLLANSGAINVNAGLFNVNSDGTNTSAMNVASGAELRFSANYTHAGGSQLNGPGLVHFADGTQSVPSGTANVNAPLLFDGTSGSIMGGTGIWQINQTMTWAGTTIMNNSGKTTFAPGSTVTVSPASATQVYLNNIRVVENSGTINWTSGRIFLDTTADNSQFVNKVGGVINLNGAQGFGNQLGARTFVNQGTINKLDVGTFAMSVQNTNLLSNTGTINANAGLFNVNSDGTNSSVMNVAMGAELRFSANYTHGDGSQLNGAGLVHFSSGSQSVPANQTAIVNAPLLFDGTTGSIMGGSGTWQINGSMTWTGNATMNGAGKTTFAPGSVVTISPASANQVYLNNTRVVENSGTINWTSGRIYLDTTAGQQPVREQA
jgi:hypothetical protein